MKKNGFIFVETIVVLVIVVLALSMIMSSYSLVVRKNNINKYYDRANEIYALYYIMKYGTTSTDNYILPLDSDGNINRFYTHRNDCAGTEINNYIPNCTNVLKDMNIIYIGVINSVEYELNNPDTKYTNGVIEYLKHLQKEKVDDDGNKIKTKYAIGVFYINKEYYYASLIIEKGE